MKTRRILVALFMIAALIVPSAVSAAPAVPVVAPVQIGIGVVGEEVQMGDYSFDIWDPDITLVSQDASKTTITGDEEEPVQLPADGVWIQSTNCEPMDIWFFRVEATGRMVREDSSWWGGEDYTAHRAYLSGPGHFVVIRQIVPDADYSVWPLLPHEPDQAVFRVMPYIGATVNPGWKTIFSRPFGVAVTLPAPGKDGYEVNAYRDLMLLEEVDGQQVFVDQSFVPGADYTPNRVQAPELRGKVHWVFPAYAPPQWTGQEDAK